MEFIFKYSVEGKISCLSIGFQEIKKFQKIENLFNFYWNELLTEMSSFKVLLILKIMKKILKCVNCVFFELQSISILLPSAINLVNSTQKDLQNLRNYKVYDEILDKYKKSACFFILNLYWKLLSSIVIKKYYKLKI